MRIYSIVIVFIIFSLYINAQTNLENTNNIVSDSEAPLNEVSTNGIATNATITTNGSVINAGIVTNITITTNGSVVTNTIITTNVGIVTNESIKPKPRIINKNSGLFIDFGLVGKYNPINLGFDFKMFYRLQMIKSENPIFKDNYVDLGIENKLRAGYNMVGVYVKLVPFTFMRLDIKSYYNIAYNGLDSGYIGIDDKNADTSPSFIEGQKGDNASGYFISIAPRFHIVFNEIVEIANRTEINFLSQGSYPYYFDRNTHLLHKKNDIEIINEISVLTHLAPLKIGPSYSILYVHGTDILEQTIDLNLDLDKYFLNDRLKLYFYLKAGWYVSKPFYANTAFISAILGVQYQIL